MYLYRQLTIIIVYDHRSDPCPVEAYGQLCHGPGLVNITGDCSEEVRKFCPVTKTGAASQVADLRERQRILILRLFMQQ